MFGVLVLYVCILYYRFSSVSSAEVTLNFLFSVTFSWVFLRSFVRKAEFFRGC